jgi:TIR domain
MVGKLWITYARKDNEEGDFDYLVHELARIGVVAVYDKIALVPGQKLWPQIDKQITKGDLVGWAILLTPKSLESEACLEELVYALDRALSVKGEAFPLLGIFHGVSVKDVPAANAAHVGTQFVVTLGTRRTLLGILTTRAVRVVRRRGDRQDRADRLDPVGVPVLVDEVDHHLGRRSSSAWAKYADALRRISLARFSSRTARSSSFIRSRSLVVSPGRFPASRCDWRTHFRSVSAVQPIFGAIDSIAAHSDSCCPC